MREKILAAPTTAASGALPQSAIARPPTRIPLWVMLALVAPLLLIGASKGFTGSQTDLMAYRCYALAWLGGAHAVAAEHLTTCGIYVGAIPTQPFAILPREYGPLALVLFVPPALAPGALYPWIFAGEMLLVVFSVTWLLARVGCPGAAHAWLFYVMLGSMATALARFDVVPAACVLLALVALRRDQQGWAYAALAAGVLLKYYPALLLPLFLVETWRTRRTLAAAWRGPVLFAGIVALSEACAALLAPDRVLDPLRFMGGRCVQVESLPATLSYLWARLTGGAVSDVYAYNATCQQSAGLDQLAALCMLLALTGIVLVAYLFWRVRVPLVLAAILTLCLAMIGTKIFSPQYLVWVSPLVALAYGLHNLRTFVLWSAVCLATTLCYPLSYGGLLPAGLHLPPPQLVPITAALRNILFALELTAVLWWVATRKYPPMAPASDVEYPDFSRVLS